ncbi:MAG: cobyric acid synthase [Cytophagales bacterium]|nr:cobyric acid synthase [Cytophagales bacterium]
MLVGTGSDVGKSILNTALCRIFLQDGFQPAPFKAQNMSLNSHATADGYEIGRAQAVQAEACRIPCRVEMNPILLKPTGDLSSQVVLNGKPIGNRTAKSYFRGEDKSRFLEEAIRAFRMLAKNHAPVVMEGAGSISELNLKDRDIANMRMAKETQADVYLVADIDRGGVFGSVYGTIELLPDEERKLVKGIIINKFRGDISLFEDGKKMLKELTDVPVVGVIPYYHNIYIEEEDSVALEGKNKLPKGSKGVKIAVVLLRHISNFTDFNVLERTPGVHLYYTNKPDELEEAEIIIIPGTKNTVADLQFLRKSGLAKTILNAQVDGKAIYGICGGYQMLGACIDDPYGVEGEAIKVPGLGLLPISTTLSKEKRTEQCRFRFRDSGNECTGYEIHMGTTTTRLRKPVAVLDNGIEDGCYLSPKLWGTYIHGIFNNRPVIKEILNLHTDHRSDQEANYENYKQEQYDLLAGHVRKHLDMNYIYQSLRAL